MSRMSMMVQSLSSGTSSATSNLTSDTTTHKRQQVGPSPRFGEAKTSPIVMALLGDKPEEALKLIQQSADVNQRCEVSREQPLFTAVMKGDGQVFNALLEAGADVNARGKNDATALMGAIRMGRIDMFYDLLEHKADINLQDDYGATALHEAVRVQEKLFFTRTLLDQPGVEVNKTDNSGSTPLHWVKTSHRPNGDVIHMLEEAGGKGDTLTDHLVNYGPAVLAGGVIAGLGLLAGKAIAE